MSTSVNKSSPITVGDTIGGADNFTYSSQRPPVPGEEDDQSSQQTVASVAGRNSKKLATCLVNGYSESLAATERYLNSNARTPVLHRHTLPDQSSSLQGGSQERKALDCRNEPGFEPEGSACASPRFKENSSSPSSAGGASASYLRWAESLKLLLNDSEGVRLFKLFLEQEQGCAASLDFWFACSGLKMVADNPDRVVGVARMIYKKYVKGDQLRLTVDVRRRVVERLRQHQIDPNMFDEAQAEVEYAMRCDDYPLFLKSDTYLQYVQSGNASPKTVNVSSTGGTSGNVPLSETDPASPALECVVRPLPTVAEDEELAIDDIRHATVASSLSLTSSALFATRRSREAVASSSYVGIPFPKLSCAKLTNPYHVSYAPVSAQDSELQSLSSDALTDDTMSYTDSSIDGRERSVFTSRRKQLKAIRRNADVNQQTDLNQPLIPRTERVPPDCNLAESDPKKFAALLTEKLLRVKEELDKLERMTTSLRSIDAMDTSYISETSLHSGALMPQNTSCALNSSVDSFPYTSMLLRSVLTDRDGDDNAQSILEEHVSRVWDSSNGPTPGGFHSPGFRTPNHHHITTANRTIGGGNIAAGVSSSKGVCGGIGPAAPKLSSSLHHRVRDDFVASSSLQPFHSEQLSHMVATQLPNQPRHAGHRHQVAAAAGGGAPSAPVACKDVRQSRLHAGTSALRADVAASAGLDGDSRRPTARRSLDTAAVSNVVRTPQQPDILASSHIPEIANERVMMWMLENEKYSGGGNKTRCSTDGSDRGSSHKRSSHKSSGRKSSSQQQSSHSQHRSNRSESLDRSRVTCNPANDVSVARLRSEFLPPPQQNTSTVDDVKRSTSSAANKYRSFVPSSNMPPPVMTTSLRECQPQPANGPLPYSSSAAIPPPSSRRIPRDSLPLSSSCEDLTLCGTKPDSRKPPSKPAVTASKPTEGTVVGYYFCDEPVPYRTTIPGRGITLGQFKQHIAKKGNYRYFFKTVCDEFESGVVNEEVTSDCVVLPLFDGKIVGKIERM